MDLKVKWDNKELDHLVADGEPVEYGTKAHFPPIDPLVHWVKTNLRFEGNKAESVAFLICRAISKRGTKGAKMFSSTLSDYKNAIMDMLNEIPEEIKRRLG
jgi:hypothetical protein